jgi:hypothetical protein
MALGTQTNTNGRTLIVRIAEDLAAASAANAIPTYADVGADLKAALQAAFPTKGSPSSCAVHAYNTAGTDTVAAKIRLVTTSRPPTASRASGRLRPPAT